MPETAVYEQGERQTMTSKLKLLGGISVLALSLSAAPAFAGPAPCISTTSGGGASTGCQYLVMVNSDGSITLANETSTNGATYDGSDDVEVGVINNYAGSPLTGLALTGSGIGGFEGDGITTYGAPSNATDTTGYGGPDTYFTNNTGDALNALFLSALTNGQTTYFSLEAPPTTGNGSLTVTPISSVPEPGSLALISVGLIGTFAVGKWRATGLRGRS